MTVNIIINFEPLIDALNSVVLKGNYKQNLEQCITQSAFIV